MADYLDRPVLAEFGQGRCINCGFLSKRDITFHDEGIHRVTVGERLDGKTRCVRVAHPTSGPAMEVENFAPCCAKRVVDLATLAKALDSYREEDHGQYHYWTGLSALFREDRECPLWYPLREDLSPKEHLEEYRMRLLEQQRRDYEKETEKKRRHFEWILLGVAVGVSVLGIVAQIVAQAFFSTDLTVIFE